MKLPVNYDEISQPQRRIIREEYMHQQNGDCCHCDMPLSQQPCNSVMALWVDESLFPPNFLKNPIHLHHDHKTGMTIGAVHAYCNAVLWQYHGE